MGAPGKRTDRLMFKPIAAAFAAVLAAPLIAGVVAAAPAPRMAIAGFDQLKTPLPYPYDEHADANAAVAAAKARALAQHKLLLIDLGGDWCPDCRILAGTMQQPELKAFVEAHYVVVTVDVGRFDKNLQIPAHYGVTGRLAGVPSVLIVDPASDRLLDAGHVAALADARHMSPQALADWLAQWTR
jgi:thiol-disulfide isomerase/thioredoxin